MLNSLNTDQSDFQLTSSNLYQNNDYWSQEPKQSFSVKEEYVSPKSLDNNSFYKNSSDDQMFNELTNFDSSSLPQMNMKFEDTDDIDSQLDELINSSTQVPTPVSTAESVTESPTLTPERLPVSATSINTITSSSSITSLGGKVSKPKKSRTSHNLIEKKYRTNINSKIIELRDAVPLLRIAADGNHATSLDDLEGLTPLAKLNKASILTKATEYIKHLEAKNEILSNDIFQLRHVLSQFQQMLPQAQGSQQPFLQPSQIPQSPQQQQQFPTPPHSSSPSLQQQQQQSQQQQRSQQPSPQQSHQHLTQQTLTDQVNMGLNGFVPTLHQVQAAQMQLQNLQQQQQQHQQQPSDQQNGRSFSNGESMSFGNKMLVGGMTTLLGSQMFGGENSDFSDFKGLSFIPIHKLFPILNSDAGQFIFKFMKFLMLLLGAFTVLEPIFVGVLSTLSDEKSEKTATPENQFSSFMILKSYLEICRIKLGFLDPVDDVDEVIKFNEGFVKKITKNMDNDGSRKFNWSELLMTLYQIEKFRSMDIVTEKNVAKRNKICSAYIELYFTKLISAKLISVKLGSFVSSIVGLQKTCDTTMYKIIKLMKHQDIESLENDDIKKIYQLVDSETEFFNNALFYENLCDILQLGKMNIFKTVFVSDANNAAQIVSISDLVQSSEDISLINLVLSMICQEVLDRNLVKYTKLLTVIDSDESIESANDDEEEEEDSTDVESKSKDELLKSIYEDISRFEKLLPVHSLRLIKSYKFLKNLMKPNLADLKDVVELIKTEACSLIDYNQVSDGKSDSSKLDKIVQYTSSNSQISKQHLNNLSLLISDDNYFLLTCTFIVYYHSVGKIDEAIQLSRFLKVNYNSSLLLFVALLETSNILIKELLNKEETLSIQLSSISQETKEASFEDKDDDSSSTINMDSTNIIESKLRNLDSDKSNVEQLICQSRLLIAQSQHSVEFKNWSLNLTKDVSDKLIKMGKKINGYD